MYQRILVPLDGSPSAEEALPHARTLARCTSARIILLRVVEPLMVPPWPTFAAPELSAQEPAGNAEAADAYLDAQVRALAEEGVAAEAVVLHGPAADEILECVREKDADLVVMCRRGRTGIVRLIAGSTAEAVLARARVPVMVVPGA